MFPKFRLLRNLDSTLSARQLWDFAADPHVRTTSGELIPEQTSGGRRPRISEM